VRQKGYLKKNLRQKEKEMNKHDIDKIKQLEENDMRADLLCNERVSKAVRMFQLKIEELEFRIKRLEKGERDDR